MINRDDEKYDNTQRQPRQQRQYGYKQQSLCQSLVLQDSVLVLPHETTLSKLSPNTDITTAYGGCHNHRVRYPGVYGMPLRHEAKESQVNQGHNQSCYPRCDNDSAVCSC